MHVEKLTLINFRNYEKTCVEPDQKMNVILGANAQGKSNLLEALFLFTTGKSFRAQREIELIKWDKDFAKIIIELISKHNERVKLEILLQAQKSKKYVSKSIKINNNIARSATELAGTFNAVLFSPDDLEIIKGSPGARRRFIDLQITQTSQIYCINLRNYFKVLEQRNSLLKSFLSNEEKIDTLHIWDEQLGKYGSLLITQRLEILDKLNKLALPILYDLSDGKEELQLNYSSNINIYGKKLDISFTEMEKENFISSLEENIKKHLHSIREKEIRKGSTTIGPHRDDINILINDKPVKNFGSQGQQRSVALTLKLAERELMQELTGEEPVLLLDDITSELDKKRCEKLINYIKNKGQIYLTQSQKADFLKPLYEKALFLNITEGTVKPGIFD